MAMMELTAENFIKLMAMMANDGSSENFLFLRRPLRTLAAVVAGLLAEAALDLGPQVLGRLLLESMQ